VVEIKALKDEIIYQTTLSSGLEIAIHPKQDFHNIHVSFQVDFGGSDLRFLANGEEHALPAGVAHFLEHLLFANKGIDLPEVFATAGAEINAYTSQSMTAYKFKTINNINYLLRVFLDNFTEFDVLDETIEKERKIIVHELTMSDDSVHFEMQQSLMKMMYSDLSIFSDVGGLVKDVRSIDRNILQKAFTTFYHPKNCTLVITGNVNVNDMLNLLETHEYNLKTWPEIPSLTRIITDSPKRIHKKTRYLNEIEENMITFAVRFPREIFKDTDRETLHTSIGSIVANVFGLGSKTFDYLEKQKLMNVSFFTKLTLEREFGYFDVYIQTNKVKRYSLTLEKILLQIAEEPLDKEFFEVNKKNILGNYITMFDNLSRSHDFLCNCLSERVRVDHYLEHILTLDVDDLDRFRQLFIKENIYQLSYLKAKKNLKTVL